MSRRLISRLLLGATILLFILWGLSLCRYSEFTFSNRFSNFTFSGALYSGTAILKLDPHDSNDIPFQGSSVPVTSLDCQLQDAYTPFGRLGIGRVSAVGCSAGPGRCNYFLDVPIWLLYLTVVGFAFGFACFSVNRSTQFKETIKGQAYDNKGTGLQ